MLDLVGVGLSIGGKPILHDLNLHVLPGEIHAILGMNGTGKSTLASVVMGLSGFSPTSGNDVIRVRESLFLNGEKSRGLAKSRIVASDHCVSEVVGEAVGNAPGARGHVDCVEIVKGKDARVSAVPRLLVADDHAKLTHEAAIGSVDKKQVETLMARGLTEEEAVDVVVLGILR